MPNIQASFMPIIPAELLNQSKIRGLTAHTLIATVLICRFQMFHQKNVQYFFNSKTNLFNFGAGIAFLLYSDFAAAVIPNSGGTIQY
jgi:hypothetical protein